MCEMCVKYMYKYASPAAEIKMNLYLSPAVSAYARFSDEQGVDLLEHVCQLE